MGKNKHGNKIKGGNGNKQSGKEKGFEKGFEKGRDWGDEKKTVEEKEIKIKKEEHRDEQIKEDGKTVLEDGKEKHKIQLITIIGEIEGHETLGSQTKATKYEHVLPLLTTVEDSSEIDGVLILLNTMGGDVEAGLAIAEMIASLSKPTVSLVLGGSHSIGVPIAVSTDYSFIVPTATMVIHPVRMNGMIIGVAQSFDYFKQIQDRITGFVASHSQISEEELLNLMMETKMLTKDVGTVLVGKQVVENGIIHEVGGIKDAMAKIHELIESKENNMENNS